MSTYARYATSNSIRYLLIGVAYENAVLIYIPLYLDQSLLYLDQSLLYL